MKKLSLLLIACALLLAYLVLRPTPSSSPTRPISAATPKPAREELPPDAKPAPSPTPPAQPMAVANVRPSAPPMVAAAPSPSNNNKKRPILHYHMDEGVAVVQGDVVVGAPIKENPPETGFAELPHMQLWPSRTIPYHIQPNVSNPDRIRQALALFSGTNLRFVPYTDQEDVLVFEEATGICKSYVGRNGGKQPVWIPPGCGPTEIAHEIMHALGFVHEQNRDDRDDFIQVEFDNIDENFKDNFEKLPAEFMKASELAPFDFESIMIYPVWMFAKGGQSTMASKIPDHPIHPSPTLSKSDIDRINALPMN